MEKCVTYEEFGAVGDGISNDYPAIVAAHKFANKNNLPVYAKDGSTYGIYEIEEEATVQTSCYFGKAHFVIHDQDLHNVKKWFFQIKSSFEEESIELDKLDKGQDTLPITYKGNAILRIYNDDKKVFIRKGLNASKGASLNEALLISKEGKILTKPNFSFEKITRGKIKCVDDEPIVIDGGIFTTIANHHKSEYNYHCRGINITRAHVTIRNLTHYIEAEEEQGAPYAGFINVQETYDFTISNCLLTPHKTYYTESSAIPGNLVPMGSYDLSFGGSIQIKLENIKQTRDILDKTYWGIMGSNFCRDFVLNNCSVSRFDAHMGVTNAWITHSEFGHMALSLIGFGLFHIDNSTIYGKNFIRLRPDYGSNFDGKIEVDNCKLVCKTGPIELITAHNSEDHDFGFECHMGRDIHINGLYIDDSKCSDDPAPIYILNSTGNPVEENRKYPYYYPESLEWNNIQSLSGKPILKCAKDF